MKTRNRPAMVTCDVSRAPLVPSGSFTTCTRISWPSFSSSSIFLGARARRFARRSAFWLPIVVGFELLELLERIDHLGDVQEAVAFEADVDERGLHAGKHFRNPALVDVADDAALPFPFDEDFGDEVVLEDGHHRLVPVGRDDHFFGHLRTPEGTWGL